MIEFSSASIFDPEGFFYELYYRYNRPNPEQFLIRRTTCIGRDVDRALDFFTNTLGLTQYQDSTMEIGSQLAAGKVGDTVRFAVCRCEHDYYGMVASLQFLQDPLNDPGDSTWEYGIGKAVLVAGCKDAAALYQRIKASGVKVTHDLFSRTVPKTGGHGKSKCIPWGSMTPMASSGRSISVRMGNSRIGRRHFRVRKIGLRGVSGYQTALLAEMVVEQCVNSNELSHVVGVQKTGHSHRP